jgi:DNA-binding response OmpR family regulator
MAVFALKILIIEDNDDLREGWLSFFQSQGHYARGVALAAELLDQVGCFTPDVYVIDLNLPDADGLDLVSHLRKIHPKVGIVVTTARALFGDRVIGYESGADIYLTKPVEPAELLAAINAAGKKWRSEAANAQALHLRMEQHLLEGPNGIVDLSPNETIVLTGLVRATGDPLARWQLAELLGSGEEHPSAANLEMRMARLRKKLVAAGAAPPCIRAVYNRGYVLVSPVLLN